jgi:hypothetical protein
LTQWERAISGQYPESTIRSYEERFTGWENNGLITGIEAISHVTNADFLGQAEKDYAIRADVFYTLLEIKWHLITSNELSGDEMKARLPPRHSLLKGTVPS